MTLDEAFYLLSHIYTVSQQRNVHDDPEVIEAFQLVVASHPEVRPELIEYWRSMAFQPDLAAPRKIGEVQQCHPFMRRLFRKCGRPGY